MEDILHGQDIEWYIRMAYGLSGGILLVMLVTAVVAYRRAKARLRALEQPKPS